jgi:predicted permease
MRELLRDLRQDVRYAIRLWSGSPGLTLAVLATLTVGVGAATAVFTFFDVLVLRPLPVRAPAQLYAVSQANRSNLDLNPVYLSLELYRQLTNGDPAFKDLIASSVVVSSGVNLSAGGSAERVRAELVSGNYFRVLGVAARTGRTFGDDDDRRSEAEPIVVLSDAAWRLRFGARPDIVGQTIRLNGQPYTVIGVMGREFFGTRVGFTPDFWVPVGLTPLLAGDLRPSRNSNYLELMMRIPSPARIGIVEESLTTAYRQWMAAAAPQSAQQPRLQLVPAGRGFSLLRGQYGWPLVILLSAVAVLLIIACGNIGSLLLARGLARQREMGIRVSQGASILRMARQLVTESLLLTLAGGGLGWCAALVIGQGLLTFLPGSAEASQFSPNVRAFLFTTAVVTVAGLMFGMVPIRIAARLDVNQVLKHDAVPRHRLFRRLDGQSALSATQIALTLVLVTAWMLFARSLDNARSVDAGFDKENIVIAALDPVRSGYSNERARSFYDQLLTRLRAQPGVRGAGLASYGSLSAVLAAGTRFVNTSMHAAGQELAPNADQTVYLNNVTPGYFGAVGMSMRKGRDFTSEDGTRGPAVAIINETAARFFFGNADPIGRRIGSGRSGPAEIEIVGVVNDVKYLDLREEARRIVYRPHAQTFRSLMTLHVSATPDPATVVAIIQREVRALDPSLPVFQVQTMRARVDDSLRQERLVATVATGLSIVGTLLALVGVFGVVNYSVARRTRELGIRIALGARPKQVLLMVLQRAFLIGLAGIIAGIPMTVASMRLYRAMLFNVSGPNPAIVGGAALALLVLALAAGYLPARRALRIDPITALRND